jgi:chemotaxis signal transduction protein
MRALVLPIGDDRYGLDLLDVREVVPEPALTPLPGAPRAVLGVINLRGDVVPVLDTASLLGLRALEHVAFVSVAEADGGPAGLATDGEPETADLRDHAGDAELPAATARYTHGGGVVTLLSLDELLAPERLAQP